MDDKVKFDITPIEEETRVVKVSVEEIVEEETPEEKPMPAEETPEEKRISEGVIKANLVAKKPIKEYVYGSVFFALAVTGILIVFLLEGYKLPGIICFLLASLASYAMFSTATTSKKIQKLLDEGKCKTIDELMTTLHKKKKYEFLRDLGGMIRSGYVVGYEVIGDNEIRKVN
ncbi:MAG: hypothetical protein J6R44_05695 [Clostridia bacterium]|nr:hypothetical protein [Clostridia bacterium]